MSVTDTNENKVLNWNAKIQIAMKSYLITLNRLKNQNSENIPTQEDYNDNCTRGIFRTWRNIYERLFLSIINGLKPLIIFARKLHRRFSTGL